MKLFLDTAHLPTIKQGLETGLIKGITTNPTLLSKEEGTIVDLIKSICSVVEPYDVSVEVTEKDPEALYAQAHRIAALAHNVVVKIPCVPAYTPLIKKLVHEGIAVNITLIFSAVQGLLMAQLGVKYLSPFIGRLDDADINGVELIRDLSIMRTTYAWKSELLAASLRSPLHVHDAALVGADIATIPPTLLNRLLNHPLTDKGLLLFEEDWKKTGITTFP